MTVRRVTLEIPVAIYERFRERAARTQRTVEAEAVEALVALAPDEDTLPVALARELDHLNHATDEVLIREARGRWTADQAEKLEALHLRQQSSALAPAEIELEHELLQAYDLAMELRAQALRLLRERGHDIRPLLTGA
jgi:hypothetical protein